MTLEFTSPPRIVFGPGKLRELPGLLAGLGTRALVITGSRPEPGARILGLLQEAKVSAALFKVASEPTVESVRSGVACANAEGSDLVVAIGGGSVIDAAKAIAVLMTNPGDIFDYLEVIGRAQPLRHSGAPFVAIPTTAGAGAEVTRNAVINSPEHRVKASLRSPHMLARLALVDPELTLDLPRALTASTGLDALTQLIEPFVSIRANPMTDGYCREGMQRIARSFRLAASDGKNLAAREDMSLASLFGGLALANAGLGAVHGFAAPIGGMFRAPHGAVCAALLPHVMQTNLRALRERQPGSQALPRYDETARLLTGNATATAEDGIAWVRELCHDLEIPSLRRYGITSSDFIELERNAAQASSMKANPILLTTSELREILERAA